MTCLICNRDADHATCPRCITTARDNLAEILHLSQALHEQAIHHAGRTSAPGHPVLGGEAMHLLAPSSVSPRAQIRQLIHRTRTALATGLPLDPHLNDHVLDEHPKDHEPPLAVLNGWADRWRHHQGHHTQLTATLDREASYLNTQMHVMAQVVDPPFDAFAADLHQCRRHLEDVLRDGIRLEKSRVPCRECGGTLTRVYAERPDDDHWQCARTRCAVQLSEDQYSRVRYQWLASSNADAWVRFAEALAAIDRPRQSLWNWINTGDVTAVCDLRTRATLVWWPDVRRMHLTTPTRKRVPA